jgi:hypothetical protein
MKKIIAMTILATLMISSFSLVANAQDQYQGTQGTWLRLRGIIKQWGTTPVFGFLGAYVAIINKSGTIQNFTMVHAMWSPAVARLNCNNTPTDNFTFSYYTARLVELEPPGISLNVSLGVMNITGLWDVYNITTTVIIPGKESPGLGWFPFNVTTVCEKMLTNATGALYVNDTLTKFKLNITGIDPLTGRCRTFYLPELNICDIYGTGKVDLLTLVQAAKLYGAKPGLGSYNQDAFDFDFNCQGYVGIGDLATIAANIHP